MRLRAIALWAVAAGWLLLLHMLLLGASAPVERRLHLHAGVGPMRVVLLSDLHVARPGDAPARLRETVTRVNALHPDLVLLAGDFLSTDTPAFAAPPGEVVSIVAGLHARLGVVAVLGNHDYGAGHAAMEAGLARVGITLLRNQAVRRGPFAILGIGDSFTGHADPRRALHAARTLGGFPVVLSHEPDVAATLDPSLRLVLSGHTHCGQVSPWPIGPVVTASAYGKRYACGPIREGERLTLVGAGLGTSSLPIRLGAPPDFWVIDFER